MECIEARALKSSFLSQMAMKANSQVFYNDDVWCLTGINSGGGAADDFPDVDELLNLDFPEKEFQEVLCFSQEDDDVTHKEGSHHSSTSTFSGADDFDSLSAGELPVPSDDLENLEWLSQFVDDTTSSGLSLLCPAGSFTERAEPNFANRVVTVNRPLRKIQAPFLLTPIPVKARSKRSRSNGRPWSLSSPPLSSGDSSSTTSSSYGSSILSPFLFTTPVRETEWFSTGEKPAKKLKRKPAETETGSISGRRCTHCQVQKTPQWRTGPLGPKTLCNACGVRFKSGRLFPEYRPAFSPTFSHEVHSNSHRKVLEMRRRKETVEFPEPGSPLMVQSL
ncbi:hypothetical protein ABFS82_02G018200 [Erythranthe guttata]|uniref:GATA transcription factor n=1 Tax=Erythranthe guttata TaxID=4155 RepID=A0A022RDN2_ERYGU|nr:PREDICTED: GATA transcription factor 5-like [Erythranthe guttata]EYU37853.1 hypothetical protein MIMGU_mgv1a009692mg [Erythranthe guttata]|eukprot:XP_012837106.1 PREDICTED: GATA transcription factor 5-like [Erythranthe guttata]